MQSYVYNFMSDFDCAVFIPMPFEEKKTQQN